MKIKCLTLGNIEYHEYRGKSGKVYHFYKDHYTEVDNNEDAFCFLNAGSKDNPLFDAEDSKAKKELFDKLEHKKDEVEDVPNDPEPVVDSDVPSDDSVDIVPEPEPVADSEPSDDVSEPEPEVKKEYTYDELKALNKDEQIVMIKEIFGKSKRAPKYEDKRIELILSSYKSEEGDI